MDIKIDDYMLYSLSFTEDLIIATQDENLLGTGNFNKTKYLAAGGTTEEKIVPICREYKY